MVIDMASRKRSGSGSKRQLKEKVVQIYESFFRGEDLSRSNANIWDELFLLKPKVNYFEAEMQKMSGEQLILIQDNLHTLFAQCIDTLGHEHNIRVVYALQAYRMFDKLPTTVRNLTPEQLKLWLSSWLARRSFYPMQEFYDEPIVDI